MISLHSNHPTQFSRYLMDRIRKDRDHDHELVHKLEPPFTPFCSAGLRNCCYWYS